MFLRDRLIENRREIQVAIGESLFALLSLSLSQRSSLIPAKFHRRPVIIRRRLKYDFNLPHPSTDLHWGGSWNRLDGNFNIHSPPSVSREISRFSASARRVVSYHSHRLRRFSPEIGLWPKRRRSWRVRSSSLSCRIGISALVRPIKLQIRLWLEAGRNCCWV